LQSSEQKHHSGINTGAPAEQTPRREGYDSQKEKYSRFNRAQPSPENASGGCACQA
jgi:hypothetical protein